MYGKIPDTLLLRETDSRHTNAKESRDTYPTEYPFISTLTQNLGACSSLSPISIKELLDPTCIDNARRGLHLYIQHRSAYPRHLKTDASGAGEPYPRRLFGPMGTVYRRSIHHRAKLRLVGGAGTGQGTAWSSGTPGDLREALVEIRLDRVRRIIPCTVRARAY